MTERKSLFKSLSAIASSQIIIGALGVVRSKILALVLGPSGVGVFFTLQSTLEFATNLFSTGLNSSIVREVASVNENTDDELDLKRIVHGAHATSLLNGILGGVVIFLSADHISYLLFQNYDWNSELKILGGVIFLTLFFRANISILEGRRRVREYTTIGILSAFMSSVVSIIYVFMAKDQAIFLILITVPVVNLFILLLYRRLLIFSGFTVTWSEIKIIISRLYSFGSVFFIAGLVTLFTEYAVKLSIVKYLGFSSVGGYFAAFSVASIYPNLISGSLVRDFFPRLVEVNSEGSKANALINAQIELGLLLVLPGVLATIIFRGDLLNLLYSSHFLFATDLILLFVLGFVLRIVSWPMSYQLVASDSKYTFMAIEIMSNLLLLSFLIPGIYYFAILGVGVAFALQYFCYMLLLLIILWKKSAFKLGLLNRGLLMSFVGSVLIIFYIESNLDRILTNVITISIMTAWIRFSVLRVLRDYYTIPDSVKRFLNSIKKKF